jgi:hypothetical protein
MARGQGITLVIVILVLIGAAAGLNYIQSLATPTEQQVEHQEQANQEAKMKAMKAKQPPNPADARKAMQALHGMNLPKQPTPGPATAPPADEVIGKPTSSTVVALGYTMDAGTAVNAAQLGQIVTAVESWGKGHPNETAKIICLDLPKSQLSDPSDQNIPLGLSINGKSVTDCDTNPGEGSFNVSLAQIVLTAVK